LTVVINVAPLLDGTGRRRAAAPPGRDDEDQHDQQGDGEQHAAAGQCGTELILWVPRTVLRPLVSAFAASRPRGHGPQPAQHDRPLWPSDSLSAVRVLGWLALLVRSDPAKTPRSWSFGTRSRTAIAEPFVGTIRRELLDHTLIINQRHAAMALREYELYYNNHQPHRSLGQAAPLRPLPDRTRTRIINVRRRDRLGGLHHEYQQVA
jgi:hypothetical protein